MLFVWPSPRARRLTLTVQPHRIVDELFQTAQDAPNPKAARRIQAVAMSQQSLAGAVIAQLTGDSPRSIRRWVTRYNLGGIDALNHPRGAGRKPNLTPDKELVTLHSHPLKHC